MFPAGRGEVGVASSDCNKSQAWPMPTCQLKDIKRVPAHGSRQKIMQHKILIVDDESDVTDMLTLNLRGAGFQVIAVEDGATALKKARSETPSLIILDLML